MSGDIIDQFRAALAEAGIVLDGEVIANGLRHRFKPDGDQRDNGVYQLCISDRLTHLTH